MKIKRITLNNFKKFSNTVIEGIPETARLVMIAGPNGSGKSSFFEAINTISFLRSNRGYSFDKEYFIKDLTTHRSSHFENNIDVELHDPESTDYSIFSYVRSAYRNDADFTMQSLSRVGSIKEEYLPKFLTATEATVARNYQRLASQAMEDLFEHADEAMTIREFREQVISELRDSVSRLFPDMIINGLGNPLSEGTFTFRKGTSKRVHYKNMSGGEKGAFDLILDILIKRREFNNTAFCIDEPEAHVNPRLHKGLLYELFRAVEPPSQLWLATHSAGMMRAASELSIERVGEVVFLDFSDRNFDDPQVITPSTPSRKFWKRAFQVAFDDIAELVSPKHIIICEGSPNGAVGPSAGMDGRILDLIFENEYPDLRFIPGGSVSELISDRHGLYQAVSTLVPGAKIQRLRDRDDLSESEVEEHLGRGVRVLNRRNLESYLFDRDIIKNLYRSRGYAEKIPDLEAAFDRYMAEAVERGRPHDDIKAIAGPLKIQIVKDLKLQGAGSSPKEFALNILAPQVTRDTMAYQELKASIFAI
ncbi:hypothetical protein GCM10011402_11410 [Paracoccus acridae]|uniref:ATPase AAA-type core domain-containing protein n=1 Tax=Paracoccus acridae TaxID=1795310 RepID=A0ABQ1VFH0_9RHOB|nr:AAA family ATPase [Paracoccus acridae]GGF61197.1 hypothetical protein GCM10011402_11410 [Paracoccus acridae]